MAISAKKRLKVYTRDGYKCVECKRTEDLTVDHILPLSKGGSDEEQNLKTMCFKCNLKKGNNLPEAKNTFFKKIFYWLGLDTELVRVRFDLEQSIKKSLTNETLIEVGLRFDKRLDEKIESYKPTLQDIARKTVASPTSVTTASLYKRVEDYNAQYKEKDKRVTKDMDLMIDRLNQIINSHNKALDRISIMEDLLASYEKLEVK